MRSLFIAAIILSLGILAALPFHKGEDSAFISPPKTTAHRTPMESSPLHELSAADNTGIASQLSGDLLNEYQSPAYMASESRPPTKLPTYAPERPSFSNSFVEPSLNLAKDSDSASNFAIPNDLARTNADWKMNQPLEMPYTGLNVESIANVPETSELPAQAWEPHQTSPNIDSRRRMDLTPTSVTSSRNLQATDLRIEMQRESGYAGSRRDEIEPTRARHFIYEPAN